MVFVVDMGLPPHQSKDSGRLVSMHDADIPLEDPYPGDTKDTGGPSQATAIEVVWWMMAPTGLWSSRSDAVYGMVCLTLLAYFLASRRGSPRLGPARRSTRKGGMRCLEAWPHTSRGVLPEWYR